MTKHVAISEAEAEFEKLVAEVETTGDEVIITRGGKPVARLVREPHLAASGELTAEEIEQRKAAIGRLQKIASELKVGASHEEIKEWINEGRR
jgi:prevent-host-death family protein